MGGQTLAFGSNRHGTWVATLLQQRSCSFRTDMVEDARVESGQPPGDLLSEVSAMGVSKGLLWVFVTYLLGVRGAYADGDAAAGKTAFGALCASCHTTEAGKN